MSQGQGSASGPAGRFWLRVCHEAALGTGAQGWRTTPLSIHEAHSCGCQQEASIPHLGAAPWGCRRVLTAERLAPLQGGVDPEREEERRARCLVEPNVGRYTLRLLPDFICWNRFAKSGPR